MHRSAGTIGCKVQLLSCVLVLSFSRATINLHVVSHVHFFVTKWEIDMGRYSTRILLAACLLDVFERLSEAPVGVDMVHKWYNVVVRRPDGCKQANASV